MRCTEQFRLSNRALWKINEIWFLCLCSRLRKVDKKPAGNFQQLHVVSELLLLRWPKLVFGDYLQLDNEPVVP